MLGECVKVSACVRSWEVMLRMAYEPTAPMPDGAVSLWRAKQRDQNEPQRFEWLVAPN